MAKKTSSTAADEVPANSFHAAILPVQQFAADSIRLVKRCTKPDAKGTQQPTQRCSMCQADRCSGSSES